jgi:hypothetical protein
MFTGYHQELNKRLDARAGLMHPRRLPQGAAPKGFNDDTLLTQ